MHPCFNSHLKKNKGHFVNWEGEVFLDREKHWKGQKIKGILVHKFKKSNKNDSSEIILHLEKRFGPGSNVVRR